METMNSKNGTAIAFTRGGVGPPLVPIDGSAADHTRSWAGAARPSSRTPSKRSSALSQTPASQGCLDSSTRR